MALNPAGGPSPGARNVSDARLNVSNMCSGLVGLAEAVDRIPDEGPVDPGELAAWRRLADRVQAGYLSRLARFDRLDGAVVEGFGATWAWLRDRAGALPTEARAEVWLARRVHNDVNRPMAATAAALAGGQVTVGQARQMASALTRLPADRAEEMEPTLVEQVAELGSAATIRICQHLITIGEDEDRVGRAERERAARHLNVRPVGGMLHLDGLLPPAQAAPLLTALDSYAQPAAGTDGERDERTAAQRRADALCEIATTVLDRGGPILGGLRPHLQLQVNLDELAGERAGSGWGREGHVGPLTSDDIRELGCDGRVSWTAHGAGAPERPGRGGRSPLVSPDGLPLDRAVAERIRAVLPPALGGPATQILAAGRTARLVPAHIRRVLNARDQGCVHPGCDRLPERCHAHHIRHWADGGPTDLDNLVLACAYHHHRWHRRGLMPVRGPDGAWRIVPDPQARGAPQRRVA